MEGVEYFSALLHTGMVHKAQHPVREGSHKDVTPATVLATAYFWAASKLNFCPEIVASYIRPFLGRVNTATPLL